MQYMDIKPTPKTLGGLVDAWENHIDSRVVLEKGKKIHVNWETYEGVGVNVRRIIKPEVGRV